MFLVSTILGLPLAPVRGVIRLGELFQQQAEQELYGSAQIRRRLEELGEAVEAGRISPEEEQRAARELLGRVVDQPAVSEPTASEPAATEPGTTEPGTTEPGTTEPGTTEPGGKGG